MKPCDRCDREQLHQLYNETLAEVVANDLTDHLAECPTCQAELESFAAEQSWWQEASQRLSKSSVECPALAIGNHPQNVPSSARPLSDWTVDDQSSRFRERAIGLLGRAWL